VADALHIDEMFDLEYPNRAIEAGFVRVQERLRIPLFSIKAYLERNRMPVGGEQ
jgi:hypothetical protein